MKKHRWMMGALAAVCTGASAQINALSSTTHYTPEELNEHAKQLAAKCQSSHQGSCSEVLEQHSAYTIILGYRDKDGEAELHKNAADVDMILSGSCILITGGVIQDAKSTSETEVRGRGIEGGIRTSLRPGELIQIPAGTPHQMLLPAGATLTYLAVKPTALPAA